MKIDWKYVATTPGYKSLKAAYIKDLQKNNKEKQLGRRPMRNNEELKKVFNKVIAKAIHYANFQGVTIDVILNEWEENRTSWWLGHYDSSTRFKKLCVVRTVKPWGIRAYKKSNKKSFRNPSERKQRNLYFIMRLQKEQSKKSPKRWDMERKKRMRRLRSKRGL